MSKSLPDSIAWIAFAFIAMAAAAIWQVQQKAADLGARHDAPVKTRHSIRKSAAAWAADPNGDYLSRCQRGLTAREVGWIVADFKCAGLDHLPHNATPAGHLAQRWTQQRWYRGALADGLRLSSEQSNQVAAKLAKNFELAANRLNQRLDAESMTQLVTASDWLGDDGSDFQPWNLCALTPEQEKITQHTIRPNAGSYHLVTLSSPFVSSPPFHFQKADPPPQFRSASTVFPFTRHQVFLGQPNPLDTRTDRSAETLIAQVRCLHPAQLKMLLLLQPAMTEQIQQALEIVVPPSAR